MRGRTVCVLVAAALVAACGDRGSDDHWSDRCDLPEDYEVLTVPPDRCLWTDPEFGKTFTAAYEATNVAKGPCHQSSYFVVGDDGTDRVYHDGDVLKITIEYSAPGCVEASLTFGGFHVNGSPWAEHYCREGGCNFGGFASNIFAGRIALTQPVGRITFVAVPGTFPPVDLASPPNLEGFQLCAIVVGFSDGRPDGSHTSEQLDFDTEPCGQRP